MHNNNNKNRTTYKCFSSNSKIDLRPKEENLRRKFLELKSTQKIIAKEVKFVTLSTLIIQRSKCLSIQNFTFFQYSFKIKAAFFFY